MSYSDFLSMFKPAPQESDSTKEDASEAAEVDQPNLAAEVPCRSIMSFFSKSSAMKGTRKVSETNSIKVMAEVHSEKKSEKSKTLPSPLKRNSSIVPHMPTDVDAIEYLGSETVITDESKSKKRKPHVESSLMSQPKKAKVSEDGLRKSSNLSLSDSPNDRTDCSKDDRAVSTNKVHLSTKTSQSQLSFGKGVLVISKAKPEVKDLKEEPEAVENEQSGKKKRGRPKKVPDVKMSEEQDSVDNCEACSSPIATTPSNVNTEAATETPETTQLRRSSRTSRPVTPFMVNEVVSVDDDDDDSDEGENKKNKDRHRQRKKKEDSCEILKTETPSSKKKTKGPLAPIFTAMKPKEEIKPPPEDPEKVRLRREFMMSGIPEVLKRQIAENVSNVTLDYPPLPNPSHVQQLNRETY
ncbi:hypothetical protein EGW08_009116, partial [Elysia chlorotica]